MPLIAGPLGPLHVVALGRDTDPPVVLLHGLFVGSLAQWYFSVAPALATRHRVVLIDLPGHGRSPARPSGYDLDSLVADVHAVVTELELRRPGLAGHSYGGLVALAYALRHGADRLALLDVPLPGHSADVRALDPEALLEALPGPVAAALAGGGRRARRLVQGVRRLASETTLLSDMAAEPMLDLDGLRCATLLAYGRDSGCLPSRAVLQQALADARVATLPGGHFLLAEAPDQVRDLLVEFFDG